MAKNPPANARGVREAGLFPGSGISPGGRSGKAVQYSFLGNPMDKRSLASYKPLGLHRVRHD